MARRRKRGLLKSGSSSGAIKVDNSKFKKRLEKLDEVPELSMKNGHIFLRNKTPIRSGNARNKTKRKDLIIRSNYSYAGRLDEGYSEQAPEGFTEPTINYLEQFIETQVGKI